MPRFCYCLFAQGHPDRPRAQCRKCTAYRDPVYQGAKERCTATSVVDDYERGTRQRMWCSLWPGHRTAHLPVPEGPLIWIANGRPIGRSDEH